MLVIASILFGSSLLYACYAQAQIIILTFYPKKLQLCDLCKDVERSQVVSWVVKSQISIKSGNRTQLFLC